MERGRVTFKWEVFPEFDTILLPASITYADCELPNVGDTIELYQVGSGDHLFVAGKITWHERHINNGVTTHHYFITRRRPIKVEGEQF
jgi:hypothetical protein